MYEGRIYSDHTSIVCSSQIFHGRIGRQNIFRDDLLKE
jgi:hypothetical protein